MANKKKCVIKLKMVRIDKRGCHLAVSGKINGKKANLIIDTGASQTVFDKKRIEHFLGHQKFEKSEALSTGLGTSSMVSHLVKIPGLVLGDFEIKDGTMILLDLSHVNESYKIMKLKPVDGVIGGDILKKYKGVIDYGKKVLVLFEK